MTILKLGQTTKDLIKNINANFAKLNTKKNYVVLYDGSVNIPSLDSGTSSTIALNDSLANYDGLILQLDDCSAYEYFGDLSVGKILKPIHNQMDFTDVMKGWNMFGYNCEILNNTHLKLDKFIYSGSSFEPHEYLDIQELRYLTQYSVYPLTRIIGIKFN